MCATNAVGDESIHCKACTVSPDAQALRDIAEKRIGWQHPRLSEIKAPIEIKILGFNDFHGHISAGTAVAGRPAGGAAVLASYLKAAQAGREDRTFIVHAGDAVGASPLSSALLRDEPTMIWLNSLGNSFCRYEARMSPRCNLIGTLGNHEFDRGVDAMLRLINGGGAKSDPSFVGKYRGASFPYISSNVVDIVTGKPILPPYVIKQVRYKKAHGKMGTMPIAFIGAVLKDTPSIVTPSGVAGIKFLDEAAAINRYVPEIRAQGVRAIVVLIHQGGSQTSEDSMFADKPSVHGEIVNIVSRLDDGIDVVVSGHAHAFTNAILHNAHGKSILVTQAFSYGTAYADIELQIDRKSRAVVAKSAAVITAFADRGAGLLPDMTSSALAARAETIVAPIANRLICTITADMMRAQNDAGESALGSFIADAQRDTMHTQIAFMNPGGIRADLRSTTAHALRIQPVDATDWLNFSAGVS